MPPRGVKSAKQKRQYQHIKQSYKKRGKSEGTAEEIAARTVNKQKAESGRTKKKGSAKKKSAAKKSSAKKSSRRSSSRKSSSRR